MSAENDPEFPDYLYEGIDDFTLNEKYLNLQKETVDLQNQIRDLKQEISVVTEKCQNLEKLNDTLQNNISAIFKTARAEISRKDRLCTDLQAKVQKYELNERMKNTNSKPFNSKGLPGNNTIPNQSADDKLPKKPVPVPTPILNIKSNQIMKDEYNNRLPHKRKHSRSPDRTSRVSPSRKFIRCDDKPRSLNEIKDKYHDKSEHRSYSKERNTESHYGNDERGSYNKERITGSYHSKETFRQNDSRSTHSYTKDEKYKRDYDRDRNKSYTSSRPEYSHSKSNRECFKSKNDLRSMNVESKYKSSDRNTEFKCRETSRNNFNTHNSNFDPTTHCNNNTNYSSNEDHNKVGTVKLLNTNDNVTNKSKFSELSVLKSHFDNKQLNDTVKKLNTNIKFSNSLVDLTNDDNVKVEKNRKFFFKDLTSKAKTSKLKELNNMIETKIEFEKQMNQKKIFKIEILHSLEVVDDKNSNMTYSKGQHTDSDINNQIKGTEHQIVKTDVSNVNNSSVNESIPHNVIVPTLKIENVKQENIFNSINCTDDTIPKEIKKDDPFLDIEGQIKNIFDDPILISKNEKSVEAETLNILPVVEKELSTDVQEKESVKTESEDCKSSNTFKKQALNILAVLYDDLNDAGNNIPDLTENSVKVETVENKNSINDEALYTNGNNIPYLDEVVLSNEGNNIYQLSLEHKQNEVIEANSKFLQTDENQHQIHSDTSLKCNESFSDNINASIALKENKLCDSIETKEMRRSNSKFDTDLKPLRDIKRSSKKISKNVSTLKDKTNSINTKVICAADSNNENFKKKIKNVEHSYKTNKEIDTISSTAQINSTNKIKNESNDNNVSNLKTISYPEKSEPDKTENALKMQIDNIEMSSNQPMSQTTKKVPSIFDTPVKTECSNHSVSTPNMINKHTLKFTIMRPRNKIVKN